MSLKLSETAADVINEMIVEAELPEGAGLRITIEGADELSLSVQPEAQAGDTTTQGHGGTGALGVAGAPRGIVGR